MEDEVILSTEEFIIGNLNLPELSDEIKQDIDSEEHDMHPYKLAGIGNRANQAYNAKKRKCYTKWVRTKDNLAWQRCLKNIIREHNKWDLDLVHEWHSALQVAHYKGEGYQFEWHQDVYDSSEHPHRKLTLVYSLSHKEDYTGGNFQIKDSSGNVTTRKFDYGDFILFPARTLHRVEPLTGGERTTLVCWYH